MAVPADTPETTPVEGLTVATAVLRLYQVPPAVVSVKVVVLPAHTDKEPDIAPVAKEEKPASNNKVER